MKRQPPKYRQQGVALILMAFIVGLGATAFIIKMMNSASLQARQDEKTYQALKTAKQALIAWAVSQPSHPGIMPFPDRNGDLSGYDGKSDCITIDATGVHLIGKLPLLSDVNCVAPQVGLSVIGRDGMGEQLWYSVSLNLIRMSDAAPSPVINPSIINNPPNPWFVVRDRNGVILSDRVAAVIIAPGAPSGSQDRSSGVASADQYLDKIVMADGVSYKNYGYQDAATNPIQEFIIGDDYKRVAKNDPTYKDQAIEPYYYNDKLVYITIDELMQPLEARAAAEATNLLKAYKAKTGEFPYASPLLAGLDNLGNVLDSHISQPLLAKGMLPIDTTDSCECPDLQSCTCNFKAITNITFTKNSGTWLAPSDAGACSSAGNKCTCTGAGSCSRSTASFSCDALGLCITDQAGINIFTIPNYVGKPKVAGNCILNLGKVICNGVGSFSLGLQEHVWFKNNLWQDFFYYEWAPTSNLQSGVKAGISALLVGTGEAIINPPYSMSKGDSQSRPPMNPFPNIADYLDSIENTDGNQQFEATSKKKTMNYNDRIFIVAP